MTRGRATRRVPAGVREFLTSRHPEAATLALWVRDVVLAAEPDFAERVDPPGTGSASAPRFGR